MSTDPQAQTAAPNIIAMFDPTGKVREIPSGQADAAKKAGGRVAIKMLDPKGTQRWIPESMVDQALKAGGKKVDAAADFTANPHGEGLYEMHNSDGDTVKVPYSRVMDASKSGLKVTQKERERFAADQTEDLQKKKVKDDAAYSALPEAIPEEPGVWDKVREKVMAATEPKTEHKGGLRAVGLGPDPMVQEMGTNFIKRVGRTLFGVADFVPSSYSALKDALSSDPKVSEDGERRLNEMHPGAQILNEAKGLKEDYKRDPKLALTNVAGDVTGMWLADKIMAHAPEVIKKTASKAAKAADAVARESMGVRKGTAEKVVAKTIEDNTAAKSKAEETNTTKTQEHLSQTQDALHKTRGAELTHEAEQRAAATRAAEDNAKAAQKHLEDTQAALHETHGKELEHRAKIEAENAKVQADHAESVAKVAEHNERVTAKHEKVANRIKEENAAADHALELRRQRETELQKQTEEYYAKEDEVKAKAKAEENAAWQPWHDKMKGVTIDGGRIAEPLRKIAGNSPDVERMLRQLIPDPGDAASDSMYAQDRLAIMRSQGMGDDYWKLPAEKRGIIDRIATSNGFEPDPIDFDPQSGVEIPVEQIHRAKSILGRYLRSGRYEGPVLGEMRQVFKVLDQAENRASLDNGAKGDLDFARETTRKYQEAFGRERHVPRTQDDIREKQANPEAYKEREDQERLNAAAKHSSELVEAHERVQSLRDEVRKMQTEDQLRKAKRQVPPPPSIGDLREGYRLKAEPKPPRLVEIEPPARVNPPDRPSEIKPSEVNPPERTAPPDRPSEVKPEIKQVGEEDIEKENREEYQKRIDYMRRHNIWIAGAELTATGVKVLNSLVKANIGTAIFDALSAAITIPVTLGGLSKLAEFLEKPAVREFFTKPTEAQIKELEKLPADQRKQVAEGLRKARVVADKKGYRVSPLIVAYIAANKSEDDVTKQKPDGGK